MHWLIAEDEVDIRNLVAMMAQMWGHTPITFETGQKAWDWLEKINTGEHDGPLPEFALMDIRMPGKRGDEIAHRIRQIPAIKDIPVVLMTAFVLSDGERFEMISQCGVDQIINKPLPDLQQLNKILHDVINNRANSTNKTDNPGKPDSTSKTDSTSKPDITSKADSTSKPDITGKADSTDKPDSTSKVDNTGKTDSTNKTDSVGKTN